MIFSVLLILICWKPDTVFIEKIRRNLQECETVISIITEEYLESTFCLVEMGAAWAMSKHYFPLV